MHAQDVEENNKQQKIIDQLCEDHYIPKIPVIIVPEEELNIMHAYFDEEAYTITVHEGTSLEYLIHEWNHYVVKLLRVAPELEENQCNIVAEGIKQEKEENSPLLHKLIKEYDKKEEPLYKDFQTTVKE